MMEDYDTPIEGSCEDCMAYYDSEGLICPCNDCEAGAP